MPASRDQAYSDILGLLTTAWVTTASQSASLIKWENVSNKSTPPTTDTPWCRATVRHATSRQASLAGAMGTRRFRRTGVLTVSVFYPSGTGLPGDTDLAKIIMDAYEGVTSSSGVIFRDVTINEIGPDGDFFMVNVVAAFEYDEIK